MIALLYREKIRVLLCVENDGAAERWPCDEIRNLYTHMRERET